MSKSKRKQRSNHWETRTSGGRTESQKQEARVSKSLGADLTPASGATALAKSDAVGSDATPGPSFRYEMKTTKAKRVPVGREELAKIWKEAINTGRVPALVITMEAMERHAPKDWILMELSTFQEITGEGGT